MSVHEKADGDIYEGRIVGGLKQGQGKMIFAEGDMYVGEWF